MAQDGNWQAEPDEAAKGSKKLAQDTKVGMNPSWERREAERDAAFRRQFAMEKATQITIAVLHDSGTLKNVLEMADSFANWLETGTLPQA